MLGHRSSWPLLVLALCTLARAVNGGAATKAVLGCDRNVFFPLPTVWRGSTGLLVSAKAASAREYCRRQGFITAGANRKITLARARLQLPVLELDSGVECTARSCQFLSAVECIPFGGTPCSADAQGNVGAGNQGRRNFGHRNSGNNNLGSDNSGSFSVGNGNTKGRSIGCGGQGVAARGRGLVNVGRATTDALQTFSTCSTSRLEVPVPPLPPPAVDPCQLPMDLCVIMDGSAGFEAWAAQQTLAMTAVNALGDPSGLLSVRQFSSTVTQVVASTSKAQSGSVAGQITAAAASGGNRRFLARAVKGCWDELMGYETGHAMRLVILLANTPSDATAFALTSVMQDAKASGVEVLVVGVGTAVNPSLLTSLASSSAKALVLPGLSAGAITSVASQLGQQLCAAGECQLRGVGFQSKGAVNKIVNGQAVSFGDFPFNALITFNSVLKPGSTYACSGTLIAPSVLLTAAHCAYDPNITDTKTARTMTVRNVIVGMTSKFCRGNAPRRTGGTIIPHKDWVPGFVDLSTAQMFDVALVILPQPVLNIKPIRLADTGPPSTGLPVTITGWGKTSAEPPKDTQLLMQAPLNTIACPNVTSPTHICLGPAPGQAPTSGCLGDSGGPSFLPGSDPVQIGITSYGDEKCNKETVVTSVWAVRPWILQTMNANGLSFS